MPKVIQLALEPRNPNYCVDKETLTSLAFPFLFILPDTKPKHESIMIRISPSDAHNSLNDSSILGLRFLTAKTHSRQLSATITRVFTYPLSCSFVMDMWLLNFENLGRKVEREMNGSLVKRQGLKL